MCFRLPRDDTDRGGPEHIGALRGIREMILSHVGENVQPVLIDTPRGKAYAMIGQSRAVAHLTYRNSPDVLLYVSSTGMQPGSFRKLLQETDE